MKSKLIYNLTIIFISLGLFVKCTDNPITYDLSDSDIVIDTLTINSISGISYSSPPLMGGTEGLYFGDFDGYKNLYSLLQYSFISMDQTVWIYDLLDSALTIDSVVFSFKSADSILSTNSQFELFYFPIGGDTVFSEVESNYLTFDDNNLSDTLSIGKGVFSNKDSDSTESVLPELRIKIKNIDEIIEFLADTSANFNRSFLLRNIEPIDEIVKIKSRETFDYPLISIFYRVETDTIQSDYFSIADVTITEPKEITGLDKNSISIGRASGLKSVLKLDFNEFPLDSSVFVIKTAKLVLNQLDQIEDDSFEISSVILADSINLSEYSDFSEDTFDIESKIMSGNFENNELVIEIRDYIQGVITGSYEPNGLKLYASPDSDPFKTVNFIFDSEDKSNNPYIKVTYVKL